eukprot:4329461-Amphidinium_carterae.1
MEKVAPFADGSRTVTDASNEVKPLMQSELYQVASEQAQSQVRIAGSCVTSLVECVRPRVQDLVENSWLST